MDQITQAKPLGGRAYGSTPHLPGSRLGPGDWHIHEGQARILTDQARDSKDRIIVTEKLDGSCVAVARIGDRLQALVRAGYAAETSPHYQHRLFSLWVEAHRDRFMDVLKDGDRFVGEWLAQAHGTLYQIRRIEDLFVVFAAFHHRQRLPHDECALLVGRADLTKARVVSDGPPISQDEVMNALGPRGFHGALEEIEGAVWLCERDGKCDFLAKHVAADKIDGKYLPVVTKGPDIWNTIDGQPVPNFLYQTLT